MSTHWQLKPTNGKRIRLKNRRVSGFHTAGGAHILLRWQSLSYDQRRRLTQEVMLTREAAEATLKILIDLLYPLRKAVTDEHAGT